MALLISLNNHQRTSKPVEGPLHFPSAPHREHSVANPNTPSQRHGGHFGSFASDDCEAATLRIIINPQSVESQKLGFRGMRHGGLGLGGEPWAVKLNTADKLFWRLLQRGIVP